MSAELDKGVIRTLYNDIERDGMSWATANQVYEMAEKNVEMYPWGKEDAVNDWIQLYEYIHPDVTERPQASTDDMRAPTLRILRRLANRVIESGRPVTDMDAMVSETEMSSGSENDLFMRTFNSTLYGNGRRTSQKAKFCRCIKQVRKTIRPRKGSTAEQAAIGVCVRSVLHRRGRTVKKFSCKKKGRLVTQKRK
jgi:hypothetical protein